jgi:outer membrane protein assembly factor BamB
MPRVSRRAAFPLPFRLPFGLPFGLPFLLPFLLPAAIVLSLPAVVWNRAADDWPQWRGPNRDGKSAETGLLKEWPAGGPALAWRATGAGEGYSSFAVANRRLYTLGAREGTEYLIAYDAASGKRLWETANGRRFENDRGSGPRATPTVDGDRIYAFGASGDLSAVDAATGKPIWKVNVLSKFGGSNINWGLSESPLVLSDRILVNAGGPIVALKKTDGSEIWKSEGRGPAGYSSAVVHEAGGIREAIYFTHTGVIGVDVNTGKRLWSYEPVANDTANIATPIVRENKVFVSSDYGTGAALLELTPDGGGIRAKEIYFTRDMRNHHASSVLVGDHLYGFSSMILTAMNFDTGQVAWRDRSVGKGSLVFADDRLYLYSERGVVGLAEATPAGYREHGRFEIKTGSLPTWSHPVVSGGKLFLRDQDTIYAYDVRAK